MTPRTMLEKLEQLQPGQPPAGALQDLQNAYGRFCKETHLLQRSVDPRWEGILTEDDRALLSEAGVELGIVRTGWRFELPSDLDYFRELSFLDENGQEDLDLDSTVRYTIKDGFIQFVDENGAMYVVDDVPDISLRYVAQAESITASLDKPLAIPDEFCDAVIYMVASEYALMAKDARLSDMYDRRYREVWRRAKAHANKQNELGYQIDYTYF